MSDIKQYDNEEIKREIIMQNDEEQKVNQEDVKEEVEEISIDVKNNKLIINKHERYKEEKNE